MSKRLASFNGPSSPLTPTKSKEKKKQPPTSSPLPTRTIKEKETDVQRLVRTTLKRTSLQLIGWEKAGWQDSKMMVDQATELDNALGSIPLDTQPRFRLVTDRLRQIHTSKEDTRVRIKEMTVDITRFSKRANQLEQALIEFIRTHGVQAAEQTPLWTGKTWSLVLHMHKILRPLDRFHYTIRELAEKIIAYGLSAGFHSEDGRVACEPLVPGQTAAVPTFEETRSAMALWAAEAKAMEELIKEWNEMCAVEVVGWDKIPDPEVSSDEDETHNVY
ncbi:unnamed protein product [Rhizoctonia solani]|uniref:Uncharacterized protein n=1 Tax=Rhizoctonia solani TaxID=456999 RepID=A0A8H3DN14_9AGAM|nr:unnamed protein product [Rhizoctonia solani]